MKTVVTLYGYKLSECPKELLEEYLYEHEKQRRSNPYEIKNIDDTIGAINVKEELSRREENSMTVIFDQRTNEIVKLDTTGNRICSFSINIFEIERLVKDMSEHLKFIQEVNAMNERALQSCKE